MSERREYFRVRALARVRLRALAKSEAERLSLAAFHFEEIHAEDREDLVQLVLRIQSQVLRAQRDEAQR